MGDPPARSRREVGHAGVSSESKQEADLRTSLTTLARMWADRYAGSGAWDGPFRGTSHLPGRVPSTDERRMNTLVVLLLTTVPGQSPVHVYQPQPVIQTYPGATFFLPTWVIRAGGRRRGVALASSPDSWHVRPIAARRAASADRPVRAHPGLGEAERDPRRGADDGRAAADFEQASHTTPGGSDAGGLVERAADDARRDAVEITDRLRRRSDLGPLAPGRSCVSSGAVTSRDRGGEGHRIMKDRIMKRGRRRGGGSALFFLFFLLLVL